MEVRKDDGGPAASTAEKKAPAGWADGSTRRSSAVGARAMLGAWRGCFYQLMKGNPINSNQSSGNKYHRLIHSVQELEGFCIVDVYCVIDAFDVTCPARQHAIKKLLCAGLRGKGDTLQNLTETRDAVDRAIVLERQRMAAKGPK